MTSAERGSLSGELDYQQLSGIELVLESDELLRKKWRSLDAAQADFRTAARKHMRACGFSAPAGQLIEDEWLTW